MVHRSFRSLPSARPVVLIGAVLPILLGGCGGAANGEPARNDQEHRAPEASSATAGRQTRLPAKGRAWVVVGADTVVAEVARTPEERSEGLMFREDLPPGTGMLFVFEDLQSRSFWMRNTFVALSIAFLDENQRIVDIQDMEPEDEDLTRSKAPALFALEVPQGWFGEHGIEVGDQAEIVFGPG